MPKRSSTYHKKYRKWKREVAQWLIGDGPANEVQYDGNQIDSIMSENDYVSQETSEQSSEDEVPDFLLTTKLPTSSEASSTLVADCASDYSLVSSSDEDSHKNCGDWEKAGSSLQSDLAQFVVESQLTRESCNKLLSVLRKHGCQLPKDKRTLVKTPRSFNVIEKCGGQYVYFGLEKALHTVACNNAIECSDLQLQINVDGIPLYKSSSTQFWPILCTVNRSRSPIIVALFLGKHKPNSLDEFLTDFVQEATDLLMKGFTCSNCEGSRTVPFMLHSVVCDAPARAFLKNIKGHTSLNACERCVAVGVSVKHRIVFSSPSCFSADKRCNIKFKNVEYIGGHQIGPTPLCSITNNCIDIVSLDYMHLVCLGIVRRIINFWKSGDRLVRLSSRHVLEISERLISMRSFIPSDFARRPRSLVELDRWKATEFRQFLLYSGPVALKSVLPSELFKHFLCLSIGVSIMLTQDTEKRTHHLNYAASLLEHFVADSQRLYGEVFVVYNVHSLLHLADDVRYFETCLDDLSAFRYENYLQTLKRLIRSASNPIVQVAKRLEEYEGVNSRPYTLPQKPGHFKISSKSRDSTVYLKNGKYAEVVEVKTDKLMCRVYKRCSLQPFYSEPCSSEVFDIFYVNKGCLDNVAVTPVLWKEIECKGVRLPHENGFVLMPLLHQNEN